MTALPEDIERIVKHGMDAMPREACGVLLPTPHPSIKSRVVPLTNRAEDPLKHSFIHPKEMLQQLMPWLEAEGERWDLSDLVLWHTHPGGHVGPSGEDLRTRDLEPGMRYLVVTLPGGEATFF